MAAASRKPPQDFEGRYFDLVESAMEGMDKKIDRIDAKQTSTENNVNRLNTKVNRLENEVFPNQAKTIKDLPAWYRDPAIIKLLTLVFGAIILVVSLIGALFGKSLPSVF